MDKCTVHQSSIYEIPSYLTLLVLRGSGSPSCPSSFLSILSLSCLFLSPHLFLSPLLSFHLAWVANRTQNSMALTLNHHPLLSTTGRKLPQEGSHVWHSPSLTVAIFLKLLPWLLASPVFPHGPVLILSHNSSQE